jgi:solute carrier family 25 oxoglutarate transporter 11
MGDGIALPAVVSFGTAGLGGIIGWCVVHPFNTLSVRNNLLLASSNPNPLTPTQLAQQIIRTEGIGSLYKGIGAGIVRQIFYSTSVFGLFEVFRDLYSDYIGPAGVGSRMAVGLASGVCAAVLSCPAEVSLVRMSNDRALPISERRGYTNVFNAANRITMEEGILTFWRGSGPFAARAMLVGATQVATYDQFKETYSKIFGVHPGTAKIQFLSAMSSGLIYSWITMPFETIKNRMAFQKQLPNSKLQYQSMIQSASLIWKREGTKAFWKGYLPYYVRCGTHTVVMFNSVEQLRNLYRNW